MDLMLTSPNISFLVCDACSCHARTVFCTLFHNNSRAASHVPAAEQQLYVQATTSYCTPLVQLPGCQHRPMFLLGVYVSPTHHCHEASEAR
jgi:hypothetical protein